MDAGYHRSRRPDQDLQRDSCSQPYPVFREKRGDLRFPRAKRGRKNHHHADDRMCLPPHIRNVTGIRHGSGYKPCRDQTADRRCPAGDQPRPGLHVCRKPSHLCPVLRYSNGRGRKAGGESARVCGAHRETQHRHRQAPRGHETHGSSSPGRSSTTRTCSSSTSRPSASTRRHVT